MNKFRSAIDKIVRHNLKNKKRVQERAVGGQKETDRYSASGRWSWWDEASEMQIEAYANAAQAMDRSARQPTERLLSCAHCGWLGWSHQAKDHRYGIVAAKRPDKCCPRCLPSHRLFYAKLTPAQEALIAP